MSGCSLSEVNNIIRDLKLIEKVKNIYDKINVKGRFIQKDTWINSISRTVWYTGENRNKTIKFIADTIDKAFLLILVQIPKRGIQKGDYSNSPESNTMLDKMYINRIYTSIIRCKEGVINLKNKTYSGDDEIEIRLDAIIATIETKLQLVKKITD